MYTIFLDGKQGARATGMGYSEFVDGFEEICKQHIDDKRARAFAFIFYNMIDGTIRSALKSARGFEILNKQSGNDITLFYLHSHSPNNLNYCDKFNQEFMRTLNISEQVTPPCIVFFRINAKEITDINFSQIDGETEDEHLIVEELRRNIKNYIDQLNKEGDISALSSMGGWISKIAFMQALRHMLSL